MLHNRILLVLDEQDTTVLLEPHFSRLLLKSKGKIISETTVERSKEWFEAFPTQDLWAAYNQLIDWDIRYKRNQILTHGISHRFLIDTALVVEEILFDRLPKEVDHAEIRIVK